MAVARTRPSFETFSSPIFPWGETTGSQTLAPAGLTGIKPYRDVGNRVVAPQHGALPLRGSRARFGAGAQMNAARAWTARGGVGPCRPVPADQRGRSLDPIRKASTERAHWRPSRMAHTTNDWPRRMSPAANTFDAGAVVVGVGAHVAARVAVHAEGVQHGLHRRYEAHGQQHQVGLDLEFRAFDLAHLHLAGRFVLEPFDARADKLLDLAVAALEQLGGHGPVALAAFLVRRGRAQLQGPVGPGHALVLGLGRLRHQLELGDRGRAVAVAGAPQSEPVSPPPITTTCLPLASVWLVRRSPATALFCWRRKSMA